MFGEKDIPIGFRFHFNLALIPSDVHVYEKLQNILDTTSSSILGLRHSRSGDTTHSHVSVCQTASNRNKRLRNSGDALSRL